MEVEAVADEHIDGFRDFRGVRVLDWFWWGHLLSLLLRALGRGEWGFNAEATLIQQCKYTR